MATPLLNDHHVLKDTENSLKFNLMFFWAFLLSILMIYLSVSYIFGLSCWPLVFTTEFWFLISNTLLLIIAADFHDAFSSKNNNHDFYRQHYMREDDMYYAFKMNTTISSHYEKKMGKYSDDQQKEEFIQEKTIHIVANNDQTDHGDCLENLRKMKKQDREIVVGVREDDQRKVPKCTRTYSDRAALMAAEKNEDDEAVLQRALSERFENAPPPRMEENDEFSRLSVDELNRRVEEFIMRFNREMRLQGARIRTEPPPN